VALVGVDTINVDDHRNPARPAHSRLLDEERFVVENPRNLSRLPRSGFRFFAVPVRTAGAAAMPVRAFAELPQGGSRSS
jgi:kynurenine formamidase